MSNKETSQRHNREFQHKKLLFSFAPSLCPLRGSGVWFAVGCWKVAGSVAIDKFMADSYLATHFPFNVITATTSSNRSGYGSPSPVNAKYPRSPHSHSHPKNDGRPTSPSNKALNSYSTGRGVLHVWCIFPRFLRIDLIFVTIPHGSHAQPQGRPLKGPRYCTSVRLDNRHASTMPNPPRLDLRKHASSRAHFRKTPRGALAWTLDIAITYSPSCWFDGTWFDATAAVRGPLNTPLSLRSETCPQPKFSLGSQWEGCIWRLTDPCWCKPGGRRGTEPTWASRWPEGQELPQDEGPEKPSGLSSSSLTHLPRSTVGGLSCKADRAGTMITLPFITTEANEWILS
ncbi:hypothetical protein K449DRAFT_431946 [Hypoxylon sp. EC38]|nr:hypothetical protein K449DRAFT_431946 [Hypoxylon sp. EC38]